MQSTFNCITVNRRQFLATLAEINIIDVKCLFKTKLRCQKPRSLKNPFDNKRLSIKLTEMLVVRQKYLFSFFYVRSIIKMITLSQSFWSCYRNQLPFTAINALRPFVKRKDEAFEPRERIKLCAACSSLNFVIPAKRKNFVLDLCSLVSIYEEKRNLNANFSKKMWIFLLPFFSLFIRSPQTFQARSAI